MFQKFRRETVPKLGTVGVSILILAFASLLMFAQEQEIEATELIEYDGGMNRFDAIMPYAQMSGVVFDAGIHSDAVFWIPGITRTTTDFDTAATIQYDFAAFTGVDFQMRHPPDYVWNDALFTQRTFDDDGQFTIWQRALAVRADVTNIIGIREQAYDELGLDNTAAIAAIITRDDEMGTIYGGLKLVA
jgi:hypothetical protein